MPVTTHPLIALALLCVTQAQVTPAQDPQDPIVAYPERDILSPFRSPSDLYAPPDELFQQLSIMQNIANRAGAKKSFDASGREVVDDPTWRQARAKVNEIGIDAGVLAGMMRLHRNAMQRETAFYGAFYCANNGYVMEFISHIPGEPTQRTREAAFPRAIQFLRANLSRRFGQLTDDEKALALGALPEIGSPVAKAQGLTRLPGDEDHLHSLRMAPFFQLLDVADTLDQAQALWFIKETITIRPDFANLWLEPSLPRLQQLLLSNAKDVRQQAIEIFQLIGTDKTPAPPSDPASPSSNEALVAWAKEAAKHLFPPIRNINDAIVQLFPSEERDAIVKAGIQALENSAIGDPYRAQRKDGSWYQGFRVGRVPEELVRLAIPMDSVITTVNGAPIGSAEELLAIVTKQANGKKPRRVMVEYVLKGQSHAIEFRIM